MGKPTPSAPKATDPSQVAQAQTASNLNTAFGQSVLNNTNQVTPAGSLTYTKNEPTDVMGTAIPSWTATTTLSPEQQKIYDSQTSVTGKTYDLANQYADRISEATKDPYSYNSLPAAPTYNEDYRKQQLAAIEQRNQPQMDRDRANLEQRLADQGVGLTDPAYTSAMDKYSRGVNDFRLGADVQAGNAAAQQFGLEATTRDRAIQEMSNLRSQPINEVSALLGTGGVQNPSFVNTPQTQVAPTDVVGAYATSAAQDQARYQQQLSQQNATTGGLFGLGGTVLGAGLRYGLPLLASSDIRMKENIRHIGHTSDGQRLYAFTYKSDPRTPHIGLMAQEVEKIRPDAVVEIGGFKYVDYGKALADA